MFVNNRYIFNPKYQSSRKLKLLNRDVKRRDFTDYIMNYGGSDIVGFSGLLTSILGVVVAPIGLLVCLAGGVTGGIITFMIGIALCWRLLMWLGHRLQNHRQDKLKKVIKSRSVSVGTASYLDNAYSALLRSRFGSTLNQLRYQNRDDLVMYKGLIDNYLVLTADIDEDIDKYSRAASEDKVQKLVNERQAMADDTGRALMNIRDAQAELLPGPAFNMADFMIDRALESARAKRLAMQDIYGLLEDPAKTSA